MNPVIEFQDVCFSYTATAPGNAKSGKAMSFAKPGKSTSFTKSGKAAARDASRASQEQTYTMQDVSFAIEPGEFVAIIGSNGAGKTTATKLMNGLLKPSSGCVSFQGVSTGDVKTSQLARQVGMLFQDPDRQICQTSVYDELALGLRAAGISEADIEKRVGCIARDFGFDTACDPFSLSRGQRQNLALACIIVGHPQVLVLDEPTCGLDYRECTYIMRRVSELNAQGTTVVMVTHDMELVIDYADRLLVMADGKLIADGRPKDIFRNPGVMHQAGILPPQMIDLSQRLDLPVAKNVGEMVECITKVISACTNPGKANTQTEGAF